MSSDPPVQAGQLSPDGLWRWDGTTWVPVARGTPMPPPRSSKSWIWWLVGGCAVLLVIGLVAAGFGAYSLVSRFQQGGFSCLPSDFPSYPGTSVTNESTQIGTEFSPGDNRRCTMVLQSNDNVDTITTFYQQSLNTGDWTVPPAHPPQGEFSFTRVSRPQTRGTVIVAARGQHSEIDIQLDS